MQSRDFCYWLQGFFEIAGAGHKEVELTGVQVEMIQKHLSLVFVHEIDPSMGDQKHQDKLNEVHAPQGPIPKWEAPKTIDGLVARC